MGRQPGARLLSVITALGVAALLMTSSVATFGGQAVAYQIDPAHTGSQSDGLTPPLKQRWSRELGNSLSTISYPLIAEGKVFVLVDNGTDNGTNIYALDEATGATVWGPNETTVNKIVPHEVSFPSHLFFQNEVTGERFLPAKP